MKYNRVCIILLRGLLLINCLGLTTGGLFARGVMTEGSTADDRAHLLERKRVEWQILRELGLLRESPTKSSAPTYTDLPFTIKSDGTVWLGNEHYQRYVKVSSAGELTTALAKAEAGDFIHLLDGVYPGNFVIKRSGSAEKPIALYGTRQAVLDGQTVERGYGLHLRADHWRLMGFTLRNAAKGIMAHGANHNLISAIELTQIGDEGLHLRAFSSHNRIEKMWIHDVGLVHPEFGEAIYIGSAVSNWESYTGGNPDRSDQNRVVGNLLGPRLTAEGIDIKEGSTGGVVQNNTFLTDDKLVVDSWIDVKGNGYAVSHNLGAYQKESEFHVPVDRLQLVTGWGENNTIYDNQAFAVTNTPAQPFFVDASNVIEEQGLNPTGSLYLILPERELPYTLSELVAYFPASFQPIGTDIILLRENLLVGRDATLQITLGDTMHIRLLSEPERIVTINGLLSQITIKGAATQQLSIESWDTNTAQPDQEQQDGRAYVLAVGSRMDVEYTGFFDLGYEEGTVSGVAWKSLSIDDDTVLGRGNVTDSHFVRNFFGAYTFEAVEMRWIANTFADNIHYGFDPHDFSNGFLVEENIAYGNGSHGIIFSRGCDANIIRRNKSYENEGHGIMIDDGKVIPGHENERYLAAVPSNANVIEDNFVVDNQDGIVIEGGEDNIIRNNTIIGHHRYGIRLKDNVNNTLVISNTVESSEDTGIYVYNDSTGNRFHDNIIASVPNGITLQDAPKTRFVNNQMKNIRGAAIILKGNVAKSVIENNHFSGVGRQPLLAQEMKGVNMERIKEENDFSQWRYHLPLVVPTLVIGTWSLIFLIPVSMTVKRFLFKK